REGTDPQDCRGIALPVEPTLVPAHGHRLRTALPRVVQREPVERFFPAALAPYDERPGRVLARRILSYRRRGNASRRVSGGPPERAPQGSPLVHVGARDGNARHVA